MDFNFFYFNLKTIIRATCKGGHGKYSSNPNGIFWPSKFTESVKDFSFSNFKNMPRCA